jgi:hypothetical protein
MNISSLIDKINNYKELIIDRGYHRDVQGFSTTLGQPNTNQNLIMIKDIIQKTRAILDGIYQSSVPDDLLILLPQEENYQYSRKDYQDRIKSLENDPETNTQDLHTKIVALINDLKIHIQTNTQKINEIENFLLPYYTKENDVVNESGKAIIALIFNNKKFYKTFDELAKTASKWNKAIKIYYQLLQSESPGDIDITSIHDGTLDIIFNINLDIAIDLTEIVKYGLVALGGYLTYLKTAKPIIDSYLGNKKLIDNEHERKKLLLENIHDSVSSLIKKQHEEKVKIDQKINKESVDKKIEEVTRIITEHLIEGNELKLLSGNDNKAKELKDEVKEKSQLVKNQYKNIGHDEIKFLTDKYSLKDENEQVP